MKHNLDTLRTEIAEYLASRGFAVFHGQSRRDESGGLYWDVAQYPDFHSFLAVAEALGVKLIIFHHRVFTSAALDSAFEELEEADVPPEERLPLERRLRELRVYQGLTAVIELSFDHDGRTYFYELESDWHRQFVETLDEIESYLPEEGEGDERDSFGGYFSRN
ncbi:MAG: hypothetical protein RMK57_10880 [Bryobacterales bacterium]|nr:hypothetical protein [Bryobacteraceae bacterium]MDW8355022.1 hypothetical protein [Bryobacterales bacterium]